MRERFVSYSLSGLLPEECSLVLDHELRVLAQYCSGVEKPIEQQQFTGHELDILLVLLDQFPYHTPFEHLLSAHTGRSVEKCREQMRKAAEIGAMDKLMRPVRNVLSRCRLKIHPFKLDVKSIIDTGYMLMKTA